MFARFDENAVMTLQDTCINETKRYGRTDGHTDGHTDARTDVKTVYPPANFIPTTNKVCGGYYNTAVKKNIIK